MMNTEKEVDANQPVQTEEPTKQPEEPLKIDPTTTIPDEKELATETKGNPATSDSPNGASRH